VEGRNDRRGGRGRGLGHCRAAGGAPNGFNRARPAQSSSERVRDNPSSQYVLIKTVVGQSIGVVDARALPVEPEGYNLLKYRWAAANVLGDWSEHAGLTGAMVTRALEAHSRARDLVRAGYPAATVGEVIGRDEAALIAAGFTAAARERALDADDPARCDYWMNAKADGPTSFPGGMVYRVRWPDGTVATGQFHPDASRDVGSVTLRERSLKK